MKNNAAIIPNKLYTLGQFSSRIDPEIRPNPVHPE